MCIYFIIIIGQLLNTKEQEAFQKKKFGYTWFLYCFVAYLICVEHFKFVQNLTIVLSTPAFKSKGHARCGRPTASNFGVNPPPPPPF